MESSRFSSIEQAVLQARANSWRQRAVCYVTRGSDQVLVFEHDEAANDSGVQLPAGGLERGETPAQAAAREAFEETGLLLHALPRHLGSCVWSRPRVGAKQVWHYFQLTAPACTRLHAGRLDTRRYGRRGRHRPTVSPAFRSAGCSRTHRQPRLTRISYRTHRAVTGV
ncbi:NUDIX hydrolase [Deinococcus radiomollis]|uniref:NUDIX domain-containing protein n=1 Tax=Deinococcus radiomollis TaxID=468916 RepID=UPI00389187BB